MLLEKFKFMYYCRNKLDNNIIEIKNKKIPESFDNFKIALLSDLHSNKNIINEIFNSIDDNKPDIIVITGDMINKYDCRFDVLNKLMEKIKNKCPVYFIYGNHEKRLKESNLKKITAIYNKCNAKNLNNKRIMIKKNNDSVCISGVDLSLKCYSLRNKNKKQCVKEQIDRYLTHIVPEIYNIVLIHNPLFFNEYSKYNADLIMCGHVHGGMINLPFFGGLLSPERKFFPKYYEGIYENNNTEMAVSRGLGHSRPGIRINNNPEIIYIILKQEC